MILREMCVVSLIYSYLAVCSLCAHAVSLLFASVCCVQFTRLMFFYILFVFVFCFLFLFFISYILCFCSVLCFVSPLVLSLSYFCTVYRPLPPAGHPIAVHIIYHFISYVSPLENCVAYVCVIFYVKTLMTVTVR